MRGRSDGTDGEAMEKGGGSPLVAGAGAIASGEGATEEAIDASSRPGAYIA